MSRRGLSWHATIACKERHTLVWWEWPIWNWRFYWRYSVHHHTATALTHCMKGMAWGLGAGLGASVVFRLMELA